MGSGQVQVRESTSQRANKCTRSRSAPSPVVANLGPAAMVRGINLKAWRAEVAKEHHLPAHVIGHDATLAAIAESAPQSLSGLQG